MDLGLDGGVALITGASKGIGLATARRLAAEGMDLMLVARGAFALEEAAAGIAGPSGRRIETEAADVSKPEDLDRVAAAVRERFGRLDALINNAGTGTYKPFAEVSDDDLMYGMAINFFAQFRLSQRVLALLRESDRAVIVNVSGRTAIATAHPPGSTCTGPAKAAELRFSEDLGNELMADGIRVVGVVPGVVTSPERFAKWEREAGIAAEEAAAIRRLSERGAGAAPGNRWGAPEEIADLIAFLASPRAGYINARSIVIDGGAHTRSYVQALADFAHSERDGPIG